MARKTYTPEQKAAALARFQLGETSDAIGKDLDVDPATVRKWVEREKETVTAVVTTHKPSLMTLIGDYLESNLGAMRNQAAYMGERAWIEAQTTPDLLSSHDHLGRRLVAVLDRLRPPTVHDDDSDHG